MFKYILFTYEALVSLPLFIGTLHSESDHWCGSPAVVRLPCQVHEGLRKWIAENISTSVADKVTDQQSTLIVDSVFRV